MKETIITIPIWLSFTESLWLASKVPLDFSKAGLFFKGNLFLRASSPLKNLPREIVTYTCAGGGGILGRYNALMVTKTASSGTSIQLNGFALRLFNATSQQQQQADNCLIN